MKNDVKPIILTDTSTGMEYTLEFTRESVRFAESRGFQIREVAAFPMTKVPELWFYAFRAHHKNVPREKTDKMLMEDLGGFTEEIVTRLGELYSAPFENTIDAEAGETPRLTVSL